jgi:HSP20 family protein
MAMEEFEYMRRKLEKLRERIEREIDRALSEMEEIMRPSWTPEGRLQPLYTMYEYPDRYVILVDLAAADKSTIDVKATEDKLIIEAKLEREVSFSDIYRTSLGQELTFRYYHHEIPLPPDADPSGIKVNVRRGNIVEIVVPKKR